MKRLFRNKLVTRRNDAFRMEALEPRVLLSADPVLGAVHMVILPDGDDTDPAAPAYVAGQFDGLPAAIADAPPDASAALADVPMADVPVAQAAGAPSLALAVDHAAPQAPGFMDSGVQIAPLDPTQAIVIGAVGDAGALSISAADIHAAGGVGGTVVVGSAAGSHVIAIGQAGAAAPLVLNNTLVLANPQQGGEIFINSALELNNGGSLVIYGSGHTTTYSADATTADDILDYDSVKIVGTVTLTAGSDGSGNIQLGANSAHTVDGDGDENPDRLTLRAPGNISIKGTVGGADALESLSVTGVMVNGVLDLPDSVTFEKQVTVNGDFRVDSSGTVTFRDTVYVQEGGNLSILHATNVIFEKGIVLSGGAGNILVEGDEISFKGGNESVIGNGELRLRPTTVGLAIELGTPVNSVTANTLNIDNSEILTFADGFSRIVIGHAAGGHAAAGTGAVRIGAINMLSQPTLRDALEVYGGSITVEDYSTPDYTLQVNGKITLDALGAITIANQVEAIDNGVLQDITLYSASGAVSQVNATADGVSNEVLRAARLNVHADAGIDLGATELASVSLENTGSGNIVLKETANGGDLQVILAQQLNSGALGGIDISTTAGALTVAGAVHADGGGAVTLSAAGSGKQLAVNQNVDSVAGAITLNSGADIALAANVASHAGGLVALNAAGAIGMGAASSVSSTHPAIDSGEVRLSAGSSVALGRVEADGAIAITAKNGAITSNRAAGLLNLDGDSAAVALSATTGLGTASSVLQSRVRALSAVNTVSGGLYLRELTGLSLAGAGAYAIDLGGSTGALSITTVDGGISVDGAVRTTGGAGNVLLQTGEALEATGADIAVRANVSSSSGSISLLSADDIVLDDLADGGAPSVRTLAGAQTLDLAAGGAIRFEAAAQLATNNGNVRLQSAGDAAIGVISAGSARIAITAGGAILDAQIDDAGTRVVNLAASAVRLDGAAIGSGAAALETATATLAARASGGAAYLNELDGLVLGSVAPVTVNRVGANGTPSAASLDGAVLSGLAVGVHADAVLVAGGNLTVDAAVTAPGGGNVRIESKAALAVNALVDGGSGNVTLLAGGALTQAAAGAVKTAGGSIDVEAGAGGIAMADGAVAQSDGGNIRYRAGGDVGVALLDARTAADRRANAIAGQAGWGAVSVNAGGAVTVTADAAPATDIYARELRLQAKNGIATSGNRLDTEAALVSADAGAGDLHLLDLSDLVVGQTAALLVNRVRLDGTSAGSTVTDAAQANLAAGRNLVLRTAAGNLTTLASGAVTAGANLLLQAGAQGKLVLGGAVTNTAGQTSLVAGGDLLQSGDVRALAGGAGVAVNAGGRIVMDAGANTVASNGNVTLEAGADIVVGKINAGASGNVRLAAGTSISDAAAAGDNDVNVTAGGLQLRAAGAIGAAGNHLETTVGLLAASAGAGGAYLRESDGLVVGSLALAGVTVGIDGAAGSAAAIVQSGLAVGAGGNLVLVSAAGDLGVTQAVSAPGAGNLLLQVSNGTLTLDAAIDGGAGQVSVIGGSIRQNAAIATSGGVDLMAYDDILMAAGARTGAGGNVRYAAEDLLAIGRIDSSAGVSLLGSAIVDAGVDGVNVGAASLRMQASGSQSSGGIGSGAAHLDTAAARIAAASTGTGMYLSATGAVSVDQVEAIAVARVTSDGATTTVTDAALSDLVSNGQLVLQAAGALTINEGSANGSGVSAAGNLLLQAGAGADLVVNAAVKSSAGHMALQAGRDLRQNADVQALGNGRTLTLDAGADIVMADGVATRTTNGNLALAAGGNVVIETLASGSAHTSVSAGGNIVDGDAAGDGEVDITGSGLRLQAKGAIGATGNAIETTVLTLSAQAGAGVTITESNGLAVDTVSVRVNRIDAAGNATQATLAQSDLTAAQGGLNLASTAGNLVVNNRVEAGGAGNVALTAHDGVILVNRAIAATGSGAIGLTARSTITLGADGDLATAGGAIAAQSGAGVVTMMEGATALANGGALRIQGLGELTLAPQQGQGGVLTVQASAGATAIQLGGAAVPAGASRLSAASIAAIGEGYSQIVVGADVPGQDIIVAGTPGSPLVFHDELALHAGGNGSVIHIEGALSAEGLHANGAVEIAGGVVLSTGNGAASGGDLVFSQNIDGATGSINDLTLAAGGDSVTVQGAIGSVKALDSLTIRDAANVTFKQAVTLDGDLVIHASGVVRFDGVLTLNGGTLTIDGASQVIIGDIVVTGQAGPLVLEADTLALHGAISGADTVVVKTADPARGIQIGTGSLDAGTLNIDAATLAKLASAGELVFGDAASTGKVTLGAIDLSAITAAPVTVHGGQVEVLAGSGVLKTAAALVLDGRNGVLLGDDVQAGGAVTIAGGNGGVTMAVGTQVVADGRIDVAAHGDVRIGQLRADLVMVDSGGLMSGNGLGAGTANIVARQASLHGYGPLAGQGSALVVDAPVVHVDARTGIVVQDTDPDDRNHFYLLDGGKMYEQAVALGSVERVTRDPAAPANTTLAYGVGGGARVEPMASLLADNGWLAGGTAGWTAGSSASRYLDDGAVADGATARAGLLSAGSLGMAQLLGQSYALGSAGQQVFSSGQPASTEAEFDYWLEALVI